ncbi:proline-rich transmembrane protein 4 [Micropterus dolomieu]|uniref:proline-rich transmembrane protein 4 n=1 Tax=Micropterus dolomieu TaxID=147949 RepID=UPI001E8DA18C|nr:proline-rich transmembrane protein 4 [Micropterus dolomieu]XP_045927939.1 proline-rich transmembrane protein 4 [Micropterus dolomieu]XP_045927940.1 proline-rich transmembrane protein 4 [Micropterus dolomieu]
MLRLLQTLAFCFGCFLLLHRQAVADEEALWGQTPSRENAPENRQRSNWWTPSLPKLPSFPSLPFQIPFYGSSDNKEKAVVLTTNAKSLTEPVDHLQDHSVSGEGSIFETSEPPTTGTRGLLASVTKIRTEPLPTGTSDSPHSSIAQSYNDTLVLDSYSPTSSYVRNTLFTNSPASTSAPEQNATHTHPPQGTARAAGPSKAATSQHPPSHTDKEEAENLTVKMWSTIAPETTVPTALTRAAAQTTTTNPGLVDTTQASTHTLGPVTTPTPSETTFVRQPHDPTVSITLHAGEATMTETHPTQSEADLGFSQARSGPMEGQPVVITTAMVIDHKPVPESIISTTQSQSVHFSIAGDLPGKEDKEDEEGVVPSTDGDGDTSLADTSTLSTKLLTTSLPLSTDILPQTLYTEDWMSSLMDSDVTFLPDCNKERSGICNLSDTWESTTSLDVKPTQNTSATNQSISPFLVPAPPMLVPLYTDWNNAMAAWGLAWDAHVYGAGCAFAMLTLASALNLLCLPLRCPSGCGYFALVSLFLLAAGCTRSFSLLYDAYGHQDRLPSTEASLMLYEAPFPCLTAAFGLVFLLLSMRSRMQLSYSAFQRPCFLACLVVLHFAAAFGPVTLLKFYQQKPPLCLFLSLISRGAFVVLATFLSAAYFVFYIYVRADSKHIYHLNNTSPTPAERYNRCPFAESRDWSRAAVTVCLSALFLLACAGLQLYAMLNAMGVAGGEEVFHPWPWWAFQFSCRLCELGVCLTLALVVAQPVYCSDHLPAAGSCWTELLASKSPILPGSYQWTLSQHEKLAIVDTVGLGETESLPLYTLMDERIGSSLNGLDLLYHSNRALAYRDLDLDLDLQGSEKPEDGGGGEPSGGSSFTSDSTTDLRPPSPINLRRSIDEALFSEALFPMSLFSPARPIRCSDLSINNHSALPSNGLCDPLSADPGLYRTSSCVEMTSQPQPPSAQSQGDTVIGAPPSPSLSSSSSCSSPERWRGSSSSCSLYRASLEGSSLVLCPSPERHAHQLLQQGGTGHGVTSGHQGHADPQRHYHALGTASQESLDLDMSSEADRSVQEEFISVCRQIDALSICSETIDL